DREQWQSCRPLLFGVSLCQSGAYSNASYIEAAPWFPLTGATRFEISTEPADGVTEYSAIAEIYSRAGQENLQFKVQATGTGETKELGSILMLDRDRHRIQWDLDLPSCPGCLRVEVGVDDESDARLNQGGYAASFNVSYQEQREAFLLARIRRAGGPVKPSPLSLSSAVPRARRQTVTDARSLLLQYSAGVPRLDLHGNYVARALLGQDDRIVVNAEMTGSGPFSSASYGSEVVYDEYRLQLQRALNAMLEGRVAQTDMTLRHIVVKGLEAMDLWIKKSTNNGNWNLSQLQRLQTQLSRGQEITIPSLSEFINIEMPHRTFVSSAVTVGYQFNKRSWTLQIPVPMGGRVTEPVRLLPRTLRTPALSIAPLGINVAPRQFTMVDSIPAFKVPERVTLKVPLFGELSIDAKVKSNVYNWTASYTALSHKHWSTFEIRTDNTITSQLLNLTTSYKSTADVSEGLNVKTEFTNRVATGLLTTTANVVASATGDATQSSFAGELAASAELPRGIRAKVASSSSGTVNFRTRNHMLNGELRVDSDFHSLAATWRSDNDGSRYSMVASNDLTVGAGLVSRNRIELQSGLRTDNLAVRTELAFREENVTNVLSVMWDGRLFRMQDTLQGRLLGVGVTSKLNAAYATGALRLSAENRAECARGRFDHMLTAGVTAEGLEVSVETNLAGAPGRAAYKASLVVDAAGAGGSANAAVTYGRVVLETSAEGSARASGLKVTANTVGRAEGSKVQHNAEGRLDGGGLALVSAYSGQILETDSSSTVNFELNRAGLSFVTKTVASYAENKVDHGCNLKVAPWSVDFTAADEVKVLGASFSNQLAAKAGFLTASVSGSASGDFLGNEVRHTYKLGYADLAGSASFDTVANLNGGKLQNQLSLEFAGLAGKVGATTTCETPALKFSNVARGAALPYSLSLEVITDSQGSLSAYGEHMGSLSNKFFLQAEPLALVLSNEYRGSTQHDVAGGSHASALRHKLGAQVNPTEQSVGWELTAELNDNRYVQKLEAQNDPLSVGAKLSAQSTVNLGFLDVNFQTPALTLPFLNVARPVRSYNVISSLGLDRAVVSSPQDFSVQASVSYDKNQDVHVISIPFVESLPALYAQLRHYIRSVLDNMRYSLTRQEIQRYYQQYQRVLDEMPGKINNAIDQLELKNKVKHVQGQLLLALQNYDPRDLSAQELMENFRHFSKNVAILGQYPLSALDSDKVKESVQLYIEQAVRRAKEFDREYGFTDTLMKAIEQLMDNVRNMDLSELTSGNRYVQEKVIQALDDLKQWLQRFDVDRVARQIQEAIRSVDVREVLGRMEQVIFVEMQKIMEKIASYLENFMTTYRVREMVQNGKKNLMQFVENYEVSENLNIIRDTLVGLDLEYQFSAKAQRMMRDMKAIDLKGYLEKLSQAVNSISQKLMSMDYPAFIKSLNELLKVALEHVENFDYNQFVVTANLWLQEQTAMVNNKLQEFNIPERVQQLRERVNTVSLNLFSYMQSFSMRDVEAYVSDWVSALFEIPAVRQVANRVLEYVEYIRLRMEETDIQAEMQKFWKGATASISDVARSVAEFDINAAVTDAVEQLNAMAASLDIQEVIQKILRYLEEGVIIPRFKLFGHVFHRTEVSLRALRRMQISTYIYTPPLIVPFTSLYLPPDLVDLKTLSSIEMPTRISLPAFTFLGKFHVEPITIDFQKIKQQIIEFLDKIRNMDMATVHRAIQDSTAQMGELTLNDIPFEKYLVVPEFRFPEIRMPEFNLPQLNLDDVKFIKMPEFQLPRIPHETRLPALGKLNANLKVMSPFYTLTATAGLHNSTEVYGSPALRSFANAQATSMSSLLAFAVSTEARLSAPRLQRLELSANAKLTHDLCGLTHSSDVTVDRSGATAQFNTQASVKSAPYTGEASSAVTFTLNRAVTWEATGSYRHVLDVPAAGTAGSMNVRSTAKLIAQGAKLEADVVTTGEAQGMVYGTSHEGMHKTEARLRVDGAVLLLSGKVDSVEKFGSLKHEATLEVAPFDRVVYAHSGDTALTGLGRGSVQVNAKVQGLRVDVTVRHSAVGTKLTSGKMTSATTFHAEPFQLLLTSNTLGGGKLQLPLRLSAKVEVVNNFTVSLAPNAQHADWTFGGDFNQYRYLHDVSVDNNAERAGARISMSGNANLEFLRKEVSLPSVLLPYTNYRTPEVRDFRIWEHTGLGALLRTPQQTLNVTAQLQYAKNKEWHAVRLPVVPALHYAAERYRHVANAAFERYRDATLQWAREAYDDTRAMGADNLPKRFTVPGFTVPLLNMEVSPYTVELPDTSILVAQSYRTPRVYLPLVGYRVPSFELSLPRVNLPPMKIPGALRRLSLPEISLRALPTALYLPAMGNLTYDFTFRCSAIAVAINSGVYNQSDIVGKLSASSASEHTILNGELSAAATLSRKRGVKLSTALALSHRAAQVSHSGVAVVNKRVGELTSDTTVKVDMPYLRVDFKQAVNASTRLRPHVRVRHVLSYKVTALELEADLSGRLEHNGTAEVAWPSLSLDSNFAGATQFKQSSSANAFSCKLDNMANLYMDQRGVRSALRNEAQSKASHASGLAWDINGKQEADLEMSPLRLYAIDKHMGRNQLRGAGVFSTQGTQSTEARLEFVQWELKGLAKGEASQGSSLTPKAASKQSLSLAVSTEKQQLAWTGEAQLGSVAYAHEAALSNERARARCSVDVSLQGHAAFLKGVVLPVYGRSLWDVLKMDVTTKARDVQVLRAASSVEYTKNPNGYVLALPVMSEGNGYRVSIPEIRLRVPDTVFMTQSFRVPFTSIVVSPYIIDLRNIQVPKMLRVPSFAFELPALPKIPMPQLDVTLEYVTMAEDYTVPFFQLIVPAFRVEVPSFTLPKELNIPAFSFLGLDSPRYVLRLDDVFSYVANFELPTFTLPAVSVEVPALRLALPTAVTLPAFGSLVGSAKVQSPVYNVTCSYSSFGGEDPDALLIIDATASSTLRFLEFDVDVKSKISPKEDGREMRTQASLSHPELTVEFLEVLTFSDSDTSEMYEATIDLLSPSLTDASMRLSYGNARARMSMSSPSLGFLGFVAERQSPQVLSAQVYARDTVSPSPPTASTHPPMHSYHTEHLGLTLEEFPSRAQESLDASKENLRSAILRAREAVGPIPDRLRSLIQELLGKVGVFAEQMQLNLVTAIRSIQEGVRPLLRQLAKRASDLVARIDAGLKDGFEKASEALEVSAKWLKQTRLQIAGSSKYYTVERLFSSALQVTTEAGEAILQALHVAYRNLHFQLYHLEFREPFAGQLVKGSDLLATLESSMEYAADRAALAYQSLDVKAAYRDAYSKASSLADDTKRAYASAVNYDYAAGASRAMLSLRDTEQLRHIHQMTQEFFVLIGDVVKATLDELTRYFNGIVETARTIQRKYLEGTALDLNLKYWEVEERAVALIRTVLDYFRQMGPKYYQDGLSLVRELANELTEVASAINLDRPEKMGAKAMELLVQAKRVVERFVVATTAKLGEVSASTGERAVRLSAEARERIREAYERFAESYDGLLERASRALDSSLERYAGLARSLVEFLRRLPRAVSGALADYAVARPGRLSLRLPQGVVSWRSFDELPRLRDEAVSGINSTVAIGRQIINERLAQTRALISANLAVLEMTMADAIPKLRQGVND
uniref:Lipid transport open beta-sheet domain-containing protein n=1 Tax=Petromyzon marinus TaxID=7757 RepID=S4RH70_PETMA